jgi:hypothetical protein
MTPCPAHDGLGTRGKMSSCPSGEARCHLALRLEVAGMRTQHRDRLRNLPSALSGCLRMTRRPPPGGAHCSTDVLVCQIGDVGRGDTLQLAASILEIACNWRERALREDPGLPVQTRLWDTVLERISIFGQRTLFKPVVVSPEAQREETEHEARLFFLFSSCFWRFMCLQATSNARHVATLVGLLIR